MEAKEFVFIRGDPTTHVFRVATGTVALYKVLAGGRQAAHRKDPTPEPSSSLIAQERSRTLATLCGSTGHFVSFNGFSAGFPLAPEAVRAGPFNNDVRNQVVEAGTQ